MIPDRLTEQPVSLSVQAVFEVDAFGSVHVDGCGEGVSGAGDRRVVAWSWWLDTVVIGVGGDLCDVAGERGPRRWCAHEVEQLVLDRGERVEGAVVEVSAHFAYPVHRHGSVAECVSDIRQAAQHVGDCEIAADTALVDTVTPRGFVRDDVTEAAVGQITGMQLGEQSKPRRVEQAISDLECVEETETRIIIQRLRIQPGQHPQPGQRSSDLARRREHRLPDVRPEEEILGFGPEELPT